MSAPSQPAPPRGIVVSNRLPPELARTLAGAGLEIRPHADLGGPEILLVDPHLALAHGASVESLIAGRAGDLLARLGDGAPALHEAVMGQAERGLFKAVLAHTRNHLGRASKILGLDRNTCARKARAFGLVDEPSRGRKPAAPKSKAPARRAQRRKRGR